jgi:3-hydroxyisobutyrate dehydrogenase-like beta-hydroxyacid dehydrogenase
MKRTIGYVGLGNIGGVMAVRLAEHNHEERQLLFTSRRTRRPQLHKKDVARDFAVAILRQQNLAIRLGCNVAIAARL